MHNITQSFTNTESKILQAERVINDLKIGVPVYLNNLDVCITSAERVAKTLYVRFFQNNESYLLISKNRAKHLNLGDNDLVLSTSYLNYSDMKSLISDACYQVSDEIISSKPPAHISQINDSLKKLQLLPTALITTRNINEASEINQSDLDHYIANQYNDIFLIDKIKLPIKNNNDVTIYLFGNFYNDNIHYAFVIGHLNVNSAVLTRVHSSCFTGDVLRSMRCDCGEQLDHAVSEIANYGSGMIIYLNQEGRNIGIRNKIKAYKIQNYGVDTVDANKVLGFEDDERNYSVAAKILQYFEINNIMLLTNNPAKIAHLKNHDINIDSVIKTNPAITAENKKYLKCKSDKMKHDFEITS